MAVARLVASMLYQMPGEEVGVFGLATLTMIVISGLATTVPARRALGIPPLVALRGE